MGVVENFKELKKLASNHEYPFDFHILLAGGLVRSSKEIKYGLYDKSWDVFHNISDVWCEYKNDEDFKKNEPMIMDAIEKRILIWTDYYQKERKNKKRRSK